MVLPRHCARVLLFFEAAKLVRLNTAPQSANSAGIMGSFGEKEDGT